jgi:TonB-dependent starch-binding outer membrane protein SusC
MNKLFTKILFMFMLVAGVSLQALAQSQVSGTVKDQSGAGIPGINVLEKGTTNGTVTDGNGKFSLSVKSGAVLMFSAVGYKAQEVEVGARTSFDISLEEDVALLQDVVVVGYGEQDKRDVTGSVTTITSKDFNAGVISSPEQLIQGRAAGVQITSASGEPGGAVNIRIRGTSSVRAGNNPLYVVDGVPLSGNETQAGGQDFGLGSSAARNPLNFLNANDIASIDVLKDASATAIYGSRGANGVVMITTKKGTQGKGVLDYSYGLSLSTITKKYDVLGRDAYLDAYEDFNGPTARQNQDGGANTDWQNEIFRTAITQNHNLSFGGGDQSTNYLFSLGYLDQEGIIEESAMKRFSVRFNGSKKFMNDKLTIGTQLSITDTRDDNVPVTQNSGFEGDLIANAIKLNPTLPVFDVRDVDGDNNRTEFTQISGSEVNPVALLALSKDFTNTIRALGNLSVEYQIIEGLSFKTVIGLDRSFSTRKSATSRDLRTNATFNKGRLFLNENQVDNRLWENYFTYKKTFGKVDLNALLGYSYQSFGNSFSNIEMTNFRTSDLDLMINNYASVDVRAANSIVPTNSGNTKDELQSYYTRVNLGISDKYLFTATVRIDGSTRFGGNNKYGVFPAFAFKWRAIDESFVPKIFSDLSMRLGYGITGNQEIQYFLYGARERYQDWDINNEGNLAGGGIDQVTFPNEELQWEQTIQYSAGIDFGFWNNRITGSLDYYNKSTDKLLAFIINAQPATTPFTYRNVDADIINSGVELSLNVIAIDKTDFRWSVGGNMAYNRNLVKKIEGLFDTGGINGQGLTGAFAQRIAAGQPLYAYFLRSFGGFDSNGISIYPDGDRQQFVGKSPLPKVVMGLSNDLRYKNFDMNIFFSGQFGQYIYSNTENAFFTAGALAGGRNVTTKVVGNGESALNSPDVSTRFLQRGDFVRLQNVTLGYNVNLNNKMISSLRFFINGQNLFVITKYDGQDPEVNTNKQINNIPSAGIDYTAYPRARTFTVGLNARF